MSKKKVKTKIKTGDRKLNPTPMAQPEKDEKDDEKPFDFGGLPDRDLKKNLGCG